MPNLYHPAGYGPAQRCFNWVEEKQEYINTETGLPVDAHGFDCDGYHVVTRQLVDEHGYDCEGFDIDGWDRAGRNRHGRDREGFCVDGYDYAGRDREGYNRDGYNRAGLDRKGYNRQGWLLAISDPSQELHTHRETGTLFDPEGYDISGFNAEGYDRDGYGQDGFDRLGYDRDGFNEDSIHKQTGTEYDPDGFDIDGFNAEGFNREGFNREGFDCEGYDEDGYDEDGYNRDGFDADGYDSDGYNEGGFNYDGYHRDTGTQWDEDGYDCNGNERESNLSQCLLGYSADVIDELHWRHPTNDPKTLLAGHEIEMYGDHDDEDDVDTTLQQLHRAYRRCNPTTSGGSTRGRCAIAKRDGSLSDAGFETVTVPLTEEQTYAVFGSFETLGNGKCSAWDCGDEVGHHIHISRSALSPLTQGKVGVFLNLPHNRRFVSTVAQREANYNTFEPEKRITRLRNRVRHSVLNVTGATLEFRMFKSNLRTSGILKNYEFAVSVCRFCQVASVSNLTHEAYLEFVAKSRHSYRYLHKFLCRVSPVYKAMVPPNSYRDDDRSQTA